MRIMVGELFWLYVSLFDDLSEGIHIALDDALELAHRRLCRSWIGTEIS